MENNSMHLEQLDIGTKLRCILPHEDGRFTPGKLYRVNNHRKKDVPGGGCYAGVRIRDDRRERKDFNFIRTSKSYIWKYFEVLE